MKTHKDIIRQTDNKDKGTYRQTQTVRQSQWQRDTQKTDRQTYRIGQRLCTSVHADTCQSTQKISLQIF